MPFRVALINDIEKGGEEGKSSNLYFDIMVLNQARLSYPIVILNVSDSFS